MRSWRRKTDTNRLRCTHASITPSATNTTFRVQERTPSVSRCYLSSHTNHPSSAIRVPMRWSLHVPKYYIDRLLIWLDTDHISSISKIEARLANKNQPPKIRLILSTSRPAPHHSQTHLLNCKISKLRPWEIFISFLFLPPRNLLTPTAITHHHQHLPRWQRKRQPVPGSPSVSTTAM